MFYILQILKIVATRLKKLDRHAMFYMAAAVSDFYVPWNKMVLSAGQLATCTHRTSNRLSRESVCYQLLQSTEKYHMLRQFSYIESAPPVCNEARSLEYITHQSYVTKLECCVIPFPQEEHKIQSGAGPLAMELAQVPKMLPILRKHWAPSAFCVSFKVCNP